MTHFIYTVSKHFNMYSVRKEYCKVNDRAKKAVTLFIFLACDANHVTQLSIPSAMRAKGYTDVEASDGTLVQQVRHESQKIKAKNTPCPESAAALLLLTLTMAAMAARVALQTFKRSCQIRWLLSLSLWVGSMLRVRNLSCCRRERNAKGSPPNNRAGGYTGGGGVQERVAMVLSKLLLTI